MNLFRTLAVVVVLGLFAGIGLGQDEVKKKKAQGFTGSVTAIEQDKDKKTTTLTVKAQPTKKTPNVDEEKKFTLTADTKFESLTGAKDNPERKPAAIADLKKGSIVFVVAKADDAKVADKVEIRSLGAKETKKAAGVAGSVTAIDPDKDKKTGTITVKVLPSKKDQNAPAEEKKFTVTADTKFESLGGTKDSPERKPAAFGDLKQGDAIVVVAKADDAKVAEKVEIRPGKKKDKK